MAYVSFLENWSKTDFMCDAEVIEHLAAIITPDTVNLTTAAGETGLFLAVYERREGVARWFLANGAKADISPDMTKKNDTYFTSSVLQLAMYRRMSPGMIHELLKAGAFPDHMCEFTGQWSIQFILNKCSFLESETVTAYIKHLLDYGAYVDIDSMEQLLEDYMYGSWKIYKHDLTTIIGEVVWNHYKWDKCAIKIQRLWRSYRRTKAVRSIQNQLRIHIHHPEHIWSDGKTTTERLFTKYNTPSIQV